jgi:hypothetical protein
VEKTTRRCHGIHLDRALPEYRNGQYSAAEGALSVAEQAAGGEHEIEATARMFHAVSLIGQGHRDEARKRFNQAEAERPPFSKDESKPLVAAKPGDTLICRPAYKASPYST